MCTHNSVLLFESENKLNGVAALLTVVNVHVCGCSFTVSDPKCHKKCSTPARISIMHEHQVS